MRSMASFGARSPQNRLKFTKSPTLVLVVASFISVWGLSSDFGGQLPRNCPRMASYAIQRIEVEALFERDDAMIQYWWCYQHRID